MQWLFLFFFCNGFFAGLVAIIFCCIAVAAGKKHIVGIPALPGVAQTFSAAGGKLDNLLAVIKALKTAEHLLYIVGPVSDPLRPVLLAVLPSLKAQR